VGESPEQSAVRLGDDLRMAVHFGARHRQGDLDLDRLATRVLDTVQSPVVVWDEFGFPVVFNGACTELFGYSPDEFANLNRTELIHPHEQAEVLRFAATRQDGQTGARRYHRRLLTYAGDVLRVECSSTGIRLQDGSTGILVEYRDMTGQLAAEQERRRQEQLYRGLVENTTGVLFTTDAESHFVTANRTCLELLGVTIHELRSKTLPDLIHPDHEPRLLEAREERNVGRNVNSFVLPLRTADGSCRWLDLDLHSVFDDEQRLLGMQGFGHDVTDEHEEREQLLQAASTDGLTGLANRRHFDEFLSQQVAAATRYGSPLSLVTLDLDHFKHLNDRYGHLAGDDVLRAVARSLASTGRESDLVARHGGEEFALVLPQTDAAGALRVAERAADAVRAVEVQHEGAVLHVTASFGVATFDQNTHRDAVGLLQAADRAVYEAKHAGRNTVRVAQRLAA